MKCGMVYLMNQTITPDSHYGGSTMKATLHITKAKDESITWSIHLGFGVSVDKYNSYRLIENAIKAARKQAKKLNIDINRVEYHDFDGKSYELAINGVTHKCVMDLAKGKVNG
jgi:hypothetical protein